MGAGARRGPRPALRLRLLRLWPARVGPRGSGGGSRPAAVRLPGPGSHRHGGGGRDDRLEGRWKGGLAGACAGGRARGGREGCRGEGGGGAEASIPPPPARLTPPCFPSHPPRATPWLRPTASRAGTAWPACRGRSSPPEMRARTPPHWACWRGEGREEWEGRGEGWERCEWWPQARAASDSGRGRHEPVYLSRRAAPVRLPARRAPPFMAPLTLDTLRKASSQGPAC